MSWNDEKRMKINNWFCLSAQNYDVSTSSRQFYDTFLNFKTSEAKVNKNRN